MPVSRATHEALKAAHRALKEKYRQRDADCLRLAEQLRTDRASDGATADTITRLSDEATLLRRILAGHILGLERTGWPEEGLRLRRQLANAGLDLSMELLSVEYDPEAEPAARNLTALEARLTAELYRSEKARAALVEEREDLIRVNSQLSRELRDRAVAGERAA